MIGQERLWGRIEAIHSAHQLSPETLNLLQKGLKNWSRYSELVHLTRVKALREIRVENGIAPLMLANSVVVSPAILIVDKGIPGLCWSQYLREDGRLLACGGVRRRRSACPPYAPRPEITRAKLDKAQSVFVVQAHGLNQYSHQKQLHHTLLAIETHLEASGFNIVASWAAGPCRLCEPEKECLGQGKCRQPKLRRYSMEGSGMAVFLTCDRIAELTRNDSWRLELIENWGLKNQVVTTFKSVIAIAVA